MCCCRSPGRWPTPTPDWRRSLEDAVRSIAEWVPDAWLAPEDALPDAASHRRAYVDYLARRLTAPRPFVEEADRARAA